MGVWDALGRGVGGGVDAYLAGKKGQEEKRQAGIRETREQELLDMAGGREASRKTELQAQIDLAAQLLKQNKIEAAELLINERTREDALGVTAFDRAMAEIRERNKGQLAVAQLRADEGEEEAEPVGGMFINGKLNREMAYLYVNRYAARIGVPINSLLGNTALLESMYKDFALTPEGSNDFRIQVFKNYVEDEKYKLYGGDVPGTDIPMASAAEGERRDLAEMAGRTPAQITTTGIETQAYADKMRRQAEEEERRKFYEGAFGTGPRAPIRGH